MKPILRLPAVLGCAVAVLRYPNLASADECRIQSIFNGATIISKAEMPPGDGYSGYSYFLMLNGEGNARGVLNTFVKAVLMPEKWGRDVLSPSGEIH